MDFAAQIALVVAGFIIVGMIALKISMWRFDQETERRKREAAVD